MANGNGNGNGKVIPLFTFLLGALLTAAGYTVAFEGRISAAEVRLTSVEAANMAHTAQTDQRIAGVMQGVNTATGLMTKIIEQNTVVIAELRAARKGD